MQTVSFQSLKSELTCNGCPFWFVLFFLARGCIMVVQYKKEYWVTGSILSHTIFLFLYPLCNSVGWYFTVEFFPQTFVENWLDLCRISEWKNLESWKKFHYEYVCCRLVLLVSSSGVVFILVFVYFFQP